jgi:hypothetical protein
MVAPEHAEAMVEERLRTAGDLHLYRWRVYVTDGSATSFLDLRAAYDEFRWECAAGRDLVAIRRDIRSTLRAGMSNCLLKHVKASSLQRRFWWEEVSG